MAHLNTIDRSASTDDTSAAPAEAECLAAANLAANLAALAETQPRLAGAFDPALPDLEFVFGRDGYLSAFDLEGCWWAGCSLPKRANTAMLRSLKVNGPVSCFLTPPHAASLSVTLEMTPAAHSIVTLAPDRFALSVLLACDDFSAAIRQHRLWFAWGERWAEELDKLFDERPGLPTPTQFIRLPVTEQETVERMIKAAQGVFAAVSARRSALAREMRDAWRPESRRGLVLCVLTSRQFALWNDAAFTLGAALTRISHQGDAEGTGQQTGSDVRVAHEAVVLSAGHKHPSACHPERDEGSPPFGTKEIPSASSGQALRCAQDDGLKPSLDLQRGSGRGDQSAGRRCRDLGDGLTPSAYVAEIVPVYLDEPLNGSPLAMLSAAAECNAMVTADVARADMKDLLPRDLPWITWVTRPRVPAFAAAGPKDSLVVADAAWKPLALEAGWPADRVELARWPDLATICAVDAGSANDALGAEQTASGLAIIADTWPLDPPNRLDDFSSQRLLWNSIRRELEAEPLILAGVDPGGYLDERLKQFSVSGEGLDLGLFVERLIVPCYGQGIARLLLGAGLPLRLFGRGWDELPEFAPRASGPVRSRAALQQAVAAAAALVHVWPTTHAHPVESAGRPVVRPLNRRTDTFIRAAVDALKPAASRSMATALCSGRLSVESIVRRTCR